jgi:hypothetical protein
MSEREGTPEEFMELAARARGGHVSEAKREEHERIVEAMHPAEPESKPEAEPDAEQEPRPSEQERQAGRPATEAEEFVARLLVPKAGHLEIVRTIHPDE